MTEHASTRIHRRDVASVIALVIMFAGCFGGSGSRARRMDVAANGEAGGAVVATVKLRDFGTDVTTANDGRVYVTVPTGRMIIVDPATAGVVSEVGIDTEPYAVAVTPDGGRAYVADLYGRDIAVVDTAKARVTGKIPVGTLHRPAQRPSAVMSPDGARVYIADTAHDELLAIATDSDKVVKDLSLPVHPIDVALGNDNRMLYVAGCKLSCVDGALLMIDTTSWATVRRIDLESPPGELVVTPDGRRAYVSNPRDATVTAIDLAGGSTTKIRVGPQPGGLAVDPAGRFVVATSFEADTLSVIATATNTIVGLGPIGRSPRAVALSADGSHAYVTYSASVLAIVDINRIPPRQ